MMVESCRLRATPPVPVQLVWIDTFTALFGTGVAPAEDKAPDGVRVTSSGAGVGAAGVG